MRHDKQVVAAFEEAFQPGQEEATQEVVDKATQKVFEKAAKQFGEEGLYVFGILNPDMGGVSFRFKRPGIRQRIEHFMGCNVTKPSRKKEADVRQKDEKDPDAQVTEDDDEGNTSGSFKARAQLLQDTASQLSRRQFTQSGKPDVGAINALLPESVEPFTAAERDKLWETDPQT